MNYSQALILLAVPEEEREQFIAEMDIENMSVRELQKAVKDRDQALQDRDLALQEKADLQKALDGEKGINTQLTQERDNLKSKAGDLQKSNRALEQEFISNFNSKDFNTPPISLWQRKIFILFPASFSSITLHIC